MMFMAHVLLLEATMTPLVRSSVTHLFYRRSIRELCVKLICPYSELCQELVQWAVASCSQIIPLYRNMLACG